jgi:hypothetical protein
MSVEQHPGKQNGGEDNDEGPRASQPYRRVVGQGLASFQLQVDVTIDMPAFAEMLNNPMFNFRKVIKADLKSLLHNLWQVILDYKRLMLSRCVVRQEKSQR